MRISNLFIHGICSLFVLAQGLLIASDSDPIDQKKTSSLKSNTRAAPPPSMVVSGDELIEKLNRFEVDEKLTQAKAQQEALEEITLKVKESSASTAATKPKVRNKENTLTRKAEAIRREMDEKVALEEEREKHKKEQDKRASASVEKKKRIIKDEGPKPIGGGKDILAYLSSSPILPKKTTFVAPREINPVDLIFIMGAGYREEGDTTKQNKTYLMYHQGQMAAGFKIMLSGKIDSLKSAIQLEDMVENEHFKSLRRDLLVENAENLKKFTSDYVMDLQGKMRYFEKFFTGFKINIYAKRIDVETRPADTLDPSGKTRKSNSGTYELISDGNPIPNLTFMLVFSVEK